MGTATKGLALTVVAGTTAAAGVYTIVAPGVSNAETVTIGTRVFEFDTAVPPGRVSSSSRRSAAMGAGWGIGPVGRGVVKEVPVGQGGMRSGIRGKG